MSLILQFPGNALTAHLDMRQRGFDQYAVRPPGERALIAPSPTSNRWGPNLGPWALMCDPSTRQRERWTGPATPERWHCPGG